MEDGYVFNGIFCEELVHMGDTLVGDRYIFQVCGGEGAGGS